MRVPMRMRIAIASGRCATLAMTAPYSAASRASDRLSSDEMIWPASASASAELSWVLRSSPMSHEGSSGNPSAVVNKRMPGRTPAEELLAKYHGDWGNSVAPLYTEYAY